MDCDALERCQDVIGYRFDDPEILSLALTHASVASSRVDSNERLEFLGDAVLGLVTCHRLYALDDEGMLEGEMTKIKSSVVSRKTCAEICMDMGLCEFVSLGKGLGSADDVPMSVAAALFEAIIGAIYVDGGFEPAESFVARHLEPAIEEAIENQHHLNYKSRLQQAAQRQWGATPQYLLLDEKGPDHAKCFEISVSIDGRHFPSAWGKSKKDAEQRAALSALDELGLVCPQAPADAADSADEPAST